MGSRWRNSLCSRDANATAASQRSGGTPVDATKIDYSQHTSHRWPFFLPDGKHFLYLAIHHEPARVGNDTLYYASLDGRENRPLFKSMSNAVFAGGYLLFARGDQLMAQPFDPASGKLSGEAVSIARGVMNDATTWHMDATAFSDKLLVMSSGGNGDWQLVWVDRDSKPVGTVADKLTNLQTAVLSPQGDRIAMTIDTGQPEIWVLDVARGVRTRLTFGPISNSFPVWSPDGKWIAYASDRGGQVGIYRKPSDGSGTEEMLLKEEHQVPSPTKWSSDGKYLLYSLGPVGSQEIWALSLDGERKPMLLLTHARIRRWPRRISLPTDVGSPILRRSREARRYTWRPFAARASGRSRPMGGRIQRGAAMEKSCTAWTTRFNLYAVPAKEVEGAIQFGSPQQLISNWSSPQVFYDVTPDGKKILLDRISQQVSQSVTVVTNYVEGEEIALSHQLSAVSFGLLPLILPFLPSTPDP